MQMPIRPKLAQDEEVGLNIVPRVIEKRFLIVSIQNFLEWGFADVGEVQILMITLDFSIRSTNQNFSKCWRNGSTTSLMKAPIHIFTNLVGMIGGASIVQVAMLW